MQIPNHLLLLSHHPDIKLNFNFDDFIEYLCSEEGNDDNADEHWISQHKLLQLDGKSLYDQVGKLEDFPNSLEEILFDASIFKPKHFEIGKSEHMRVKKEHRDYRSYFNQGSWNKVAERNAKDIDIFDYSYMK